jgi:DNA repair ATPase RecN
MAQLNLASNDQTAAFLENLTKAQLVASDFVSKMDNANRTIEDLAGQLQDREPHLVQIRTITEQFNNSVRSLHDIAEEFRYSADQYRAVNDAHRSDQ